MAGIFKLLDSGKASYGGLCRWEKLAVLLCFCCIVASIIQLVMPVIKSLVALSLLTGTADKLWSSIYCSPCGNYRGKDFGSNTIAALCWCDEPEKAMAILTVLMTKKHTQFNWGQVSAHLGQIDRSGKMSGARWLELCRPFAEHQSRILAAQHTNIGDACFYRRPATFSLIAGYENHGLLSECEAWYKKLIAKEEEVRGKESFPVRELLLTLANFYEKHNRRVDADKVMAQLQVMATHPDKYGERWTLERTFGGSYKRVGLNAN